MYSSLTKQQTGRGLFSGRRSGERHVILYGPNGFQSASYMGPATHLNDRIREGVEPVTKSDKVAQAHDLRYWAANSHDDIRAADKKMIAKLDDIQSKGEDYKLNIYQGKLGIKAKMAMEDWGVAKPENFTTFGDWENDSPEDQKMLRAKLAELEQEGYGQHGKGRSKSTGKFVKWADHVKAYRAEHPGISYKEALKGAKKTYRKNSAVYKSKSK